MLDALKQAIGEKKEPESFATGGSIKDVLPPIKQAKETTEQVDVNKDSVEINNLIEALKAIVSDVKVNGKSVTLTCRKVNIEIALQ